MRGTLAGAGLNRKSATLMTAMGAMVVAGTTMLMTGSASASVIAADDANNGYTSPYTSQNLGSGFSGWGENNNGGGQYLSTSPSVAGPQSFAIYSGSGNEQIDRILTTPVAAAEYTLLGHNDVDNNTSFSGFNIKSSTSATFGTGELLSFGLAPASGNADVTVTDSSGIHALAIPGDAELRGANLKYDLTFDTTADTYSLTVTDLFNSNHGTITGSLIGGGGSPVAALGFANFNTGGGQNLIFNQPTLSSVPEPASMAVLGFAAVFGLRRKSRV